MFASIKFGTAGRVPYRTLQQKAVDRKIAQRRRRIWRREKLVPRLFLAFMVGTVVFLLFVFMVYGPWCERLMAEMK